MDIKLDEDIDVLGDTGFIIHCSKKYIMLY